MEAKLQKSGPRRPELRTPALHHSIQRLALHLVMWDSHHTVFVLILMQWKLGILQLWNQQSVGDIYALYAPQRSVTLPALWLISCFMAEVLLFLNAFSLIPLTVDCGISSNDEISQTALLQRWALQNNPFFHKCLVKTRCLNLYTCGNGSDWNNWIQSLRGPYTVYLYTCYLYIAFNTHCSALQRIVLYKLQWASHRRHWQAKTLWDV